MDSALAKQRAKQLLRRTVGEPYVGKRLKQRAIGRELSRLRLDPEVVVDAGCEDATFVYWLADRFPRARVVAVDIDAGAVARCAAARPSGYARQVDFRVASFAELASNSADVIAALDVLEHIDDDVAALADLFRALRPGGHLLIHVPRNPWTHADGRVEFVPDEDAWRINPGHVRHGYDPLRLTSLVANAGFEVIDRQLWLRRRSVQAFNFYQRVEHPAPLRLLAVPVTDVLGLLDRRRPEAEGNAIWVVARKPVPSP
ncbi:MAG: class I SAM-dependent methyltransferase [Tetrasphaera sp.]